MVALEPPPWGDAPFDYQRVVQPVLDAKCVSCHDGTLPGRTDLRGHLDAQRVPASYRALIAGGWVHYFDWIYGSRHFKAEPLTFGTLQSRLFEALAQRVAPGSPPRPRRTARAQGLDRPQLPALARLPLPPGSPGHGRRTLTHFFPALRAPLSPIPAH